jgi:hypothetical protein
MTLLNHNLLHFVLTHLTVGSHNAAVFPQFNCCSVARADFALNTCFVLLPHCPTSYPQGHVLQDNSHRCIAILVTINIQQSLYFRYVTLASLLCCCVQYDKLYCVWGLGGGGVKVLLSAEVGRCLAQCGA